MTQKDKELLLKDLCARLPYGVKVQTAYPDAKILEGIQFPDYIGISDGYYSLDVMECKPYLFPLSSMTEEQKKKYNCLKHTVFGYHYEYGDVVEEIELYESPESFVYLIENHFDYYGLIPVGLANDATGLNIY